MNDSYFKLFQLPESYDVNMKLLKKHYQTVRKNIHPDRFVNSSDLEKRAAVQYSALINDAYQTLLSPIKRAVYLLKLKGVDLDLEHETLKDEDFLMEQLTFRERIDDGEDLTKVFNARADSLQLALEVAFEAKDYAEAKALTQQLQFFSLKKWSS